MHIKYCENKNDSIIHLRFVYFAEVLENLTLDGFRFSLQNKMNIIYFRKSFIKQLFCGLNPYLKRKFFVINYSSGLKIVI